MEITAGVIVIGICISCLLFLGGYMLGLEGNNKLIQTLTDLIKDYQKNGALELDALKERLEGLNEEQEIRNLLIEEMKKRIEGIREEVAERKRLVERLKTENDSFDGIVEEINKRRKN